MVVLNVGGPVEITIESDGKLEEYNVMTKSATMQECHVASTAEKEFSIRIKIQPHQVAQIDRSLYVYADGIFIRGLVLRSNQSTDFKLNGALISDGVQTFERALTFGKMKLKEDDSTSSSANLGISPDLGTVLVRLIAVSLGGSRPMVGSAPKLPGDDAISEKAKKAGAHTARLGEAKPVAAQTSITAIPLTAWLPSEVTYRYAPIDFLYAREIVARPERKQSPQPARPVASTSATSGGIGAPSGSTPRVKAEGEKKYKGKIISVASSSASRSGASPGPSNPKKRPSAQMDVIDLCSDNDDDEMGGADDSGLTSAERKQLARLEAKKNAAKQKIKSERGSPEKKRVKTEKDAKSKLFESGEVIILSD